MKKKILTALLTAGMTAVMLAGCASGTSAGTAEESGGSLGTGSTEAVTAAEAGTKEAVAGESAEAIVSQPTEITLIFADGDEGFKEVMNSVVEKFNTAYPDITVIIEPGNGGAYSEFLKTKDSVGEFPDVMEMRDTAVYVRAGKLEPLPEDIVSLFKTTTAFDGEVYTAPMAAENAQGIIYNKAYFDENGWTEPSTYEEFIELCGKIIYKF